MQYHSFYFSKYFNIKRAFNYDEKRDSNSWNLFSNIRFYRFGCRGYCIFKLQLLALYPRFMCGVLSATELFHSCDRRNYRWRNTRNNWNNPHYNRFQS